MAKNAGRVVRIVEALFLADPARRKSRNRARVGFRCIFFLQDVRKSSLAAPITQENVLPADPGSVPSPRVMPAQNQFIYLLTLYVSNFTGWFSGICARIVGRSSSTWS